MANKRTGYVGAVLSKGLVKDIDGEAKRMEAEVPGSSFTRSDAIRVLLQEALSARALRRTKKRRAAA